MYKKYQNSFFFIVIIFSITSCVNTRMNTYFNDTKDAVIVPNSEDLTLPLIQKNDLLSIIITSLNTEASAVFNMSNNSSISTITNAGGNQTASGYLVNAEGFIQLPILGNVKVAGFNTKDVKETITAILLQKSY